MVANGVTKYCNTTLVAPFTIACKTPGTVIRGLNTKCDPFYLYDVFLSATALRYMSRYTTRCECTLSSSDVFDWRCWFTSCRLITCCGDYRSTRHNRGVITLSSTGSSKVCEVRRRIHPAQRRPKERLRSWRTASESSRKSAFSA